MNVKGSLPPIFLQVAGLVLLVIFVIVWVVLGIQSPLLVGAALTLVAVGSGTSAIVTVRQEIEIAKHDEHAQITAIPQQLPPPAPAPPAAPII